MNLLNKAQLKLSGFYALVIFGVLVAVDLFINLTRTWFVEREITSSTNPETAQQLNLIIQTVVTELRPVSYVVFFFITVLIAIVSYMLARRALKPINDMVQSQRRFLANAAHELRTPLTLIRTETELSKRGAASMSREDLEAVIDHVSVEVVKMAEIINNLLLISSAGLGKQAIPFVEVQFSDAVSRAIENCRGLAEEQGVVLEDRVAHNIQVRGNLVALEQIATNVIRNAIVHTPPQGTVKVELAASKRMAKLVVEDTGVGIRPDELPHIFDPFFKGSIKKADKKDTGTGLGLPIVKELVELHSGLIHISSEPHKGTTVRVTIPRV